MDVALYLIATALGSVFRTAIIYFIIEFIVRKTTKKKSPVVSLIVTYVITATLVIVFKTPLYMFEFLFIPIWWIMIKQDKKAPPST